MIQDRIAIQKFGRHESAAPAARKLYFEWVYLYIQAYDIYSPLLSESVFLDVEPSTRSNSKIVKRNSE
jgi:hypothetical protein